MSWDSNNGGNGCVPHVVEFVVNLLLELVTLL